MTIVCGTDMTEAAMRASRAAASLAKRLAVPLALVHVVEELGAKLTFQEQGDTAFAARRAQLAAAAAELRERFGIEVVPTIVPGRPDVELINLAASLDADLIVVAAVGQTQRYRWLLGSVAERIAQHAHTPALIVRDGAAIEAWASGKRALEVVIGVELSPTSKAAVQWATRLRRIAPCNLEIVRLASYVDEQLRFGIETHPASASQVEAILRRDLQAWVGSLEGDGETVIDVHAESGRVDWQLAQLADSADLVVVGTHRRAGLERWWSGSVSRGVLKHASTNVACVPLTEALAAEPPPPAPIQRVLVATDLSPLGNRAIRVAYDLVAGGGVVHLVHVVAPGTGDVGALEQALRELVPAERPETVETELEIIPASDVATTIAQAAGRHGVDLVCMATRGRSGLSSAILGSQAQRVVATVRHPVVLVPPERA